MKNKSKKKKAKKFLKSFLIIILGLPLAALISHSLALKGKIFPNVFICQYNLGGKKPAEVKKFIALEKLSLTYEGERWEINLKDLEFEIDWENSIKKAYEVGRQENFLKNFSKKISLLKIPEHLSFQYLVNQDKLEEKVNLISEKIYVPAVNPQIKIEKDNSGKKVIRIDPGKNGVEVDKRRLFSLISQKLSCPEPTSLAIPIINLLPTFTEKEKEVLISRGGKILDKTLKINFKDQVWNLEDEDLIGFINPREGLAEEKVDEYIENLKTLVQSDPQNATFKFEEGKVAVFAPAKEGVLLDRKQTKELFYQAFSRLENEPDLKETNLEIAVSLIPPKIKNEDVNSLGIKEEIGVGKSNFKGSISERIHNITLAAAKLNGIIVEPEETFSFNQALGDVSEETGFKKAYIIKEGRTILGDGGGVCQVSTTLFRATLNAGLPIEERQAHAYRVSYYEQDSQPGLDATVFAPSPDLRFKNDTPAHLLINTEVNIKAKTLVFRFYGTSDGRKSEIGKAYVWDVVPPPPDLYQDDPSLPAGTVKQVDWKAWGAKVRFSWKVTRGEETLQDKTFYSQYRPWQAIYLRGIANR